MTADDVSARTASGQAVITRSRGMRGTAKSSRRAGGHVSPWVAVFLGLLVAVFSVLSPDGFATGYNARLIASAAAIVLILAVGQTVVMITGGIDLSVGSVLVFSGVIAARLMGAVDAASVVAIALLGLTAAIAAGALVGLINGLLVSIGIPALIATLGTLSVAMGASQIITGGFDISNVPRSLTSGLGYGTALGLLPWVVIVAIIVAAVVAALLHFTRFGIRVYAVGSNAEAARRAGIDVPLHYVRVYVLCGLLAGLAGFLSLVRFSSTTISGHGTDNLVAIAAVVLGGTSVTGGVGTVAGTVIGVLIPVVLQNGFVILGVQPYWQTAATGVILVAAVFFDFYRQGRIRLEGRITTVFRRKHRRQGSPTSSTRPSPNRHNEEGETR